MSAFSCHGAWPVEANSTYMRRVDFLIPYASSRWCVFDAAAYE